MKKLIKYLIKSAGFELVEAGYFARLVNINQVKLLDYFYILKDRFSTNEKLLIFDIGANIGQTARKIHGHFPEADIWCFEPVKSTFNLLENNIHGMPHVRAYNFAFGDVNQEAEIFLTQDSEWNSLVPVLNDRARNTGAVSETIEVKTLDTFISENGVTKIDILKCDTEGFEINVLDGATESLKSQTFEFLYLEVGFSRDDKQHTNLVTLIEYLEKYNYKFSGLFEKAYLENFTISYANALFTRA